MSGIPFFAKGFVKDGFMKRTEQALDKLRLLYHNRL
jgi:hypothetical protein